MSSKSIDKLMVNLLRSKRITKKFQTVVIKKKKKNRHRARAGRRFRRICPPKLHNDDVTQNVTSSTTINNDVFGFILKSTPKYFYVEIQFYTM